MFNRFGGGRIRDTFNQADDVTRVISLVFLVLFIIIILPTLAPRIPAIANGPTCSSLFSPVGDGTQQSLMARSADPSSVRLRLDALSTAIGAAGLTLQVHFSNQSGGPVILALVPNEAVFRYTNGDQGLMFAIQSVQGQGLGEPVTSRAPAPSRQQFTPDQLHVLSSRQTCTQNVLITTDRLAAAGLTPGGQYQIKAIYRNTVRGILPGLGSALTPTPMFPDQGVWVTTGNGIQSNTIGVGFNVTPLPFQ